MKPRSAAKRIVASVGVLACLGVVAVIGVAGYFVYHCIVPEKMDITGRVVDSSGEPVKGIEVHAVPLPLNDPYSDIDMEPQDTERTVISDENGRYRFKGLVASVGVKEGRCMQGYDIVARARGRSSAALRACKHPDDRRSVIELGDLVIAEQSGSGDGGEGS